MSPCSFPIFMALWNKSQRQATPRHHLRIASWLVTKGSRARARLLLMAFRSCGKSTLVGLYCAWRLWVAPDTRIIVLSADLALARKMVRNVKRIIERHPFTRHLIPRDADQWGSDRFTVTRKMELRDPSMLAKGVTTNLTGTRADVIICDDVEVPRTCDSAEKRETLRERLLELDYILTPGGMQFYVGTPHCWHTIYADTPRRELGEDAPFLSNFERFVLPVINEGGVSAWPERFTLAAIEAVKLKTGPLQFASQMMCEPVNPANGSLAHQNIQFYNEELDIQVAGGETISRLGERRMAGVSAWWDPSFGQDNRDRSILAVVYTDADGEYWVQHIEQLRIDKNSNTDAATQQCQRVVELVREYSLSCIGVETNGLGQFLPGRLRTELAAAGVACGVKEQHNSKPKHIRIQEAFDAVLAARALHVHQRVCATPFMTEMQEWRPERQRGHDDCLDAVAGAMAMQPIRIKRKPPSGPGQIVMRRPPCRVKTEFDI